jgi:hypothetical protein
VEYKQFCHLFLSQFSFATEYTSTHQTQSLRCRIRRQLGEMAAPLPLSAEDMLRVNGSRRFAAAMAAASPFASLADALLAARRIWLDEVCHLLAFASSTFLLSLLEFPSTRGTSVSCCTDGVLAARARATTHR